MPCFGDMLVPWRVFFETNTIFVALMEQGKDEKLFSEWPRRGTGPDVASYPPENYLPNRKGSSSNHHFSGAMLNFRGVRLYGMQPKNPCQHGSGEGVFVILGGGSHP